MAVRRIEDIKPTGIESDVWEGPYDEAKQEMENKGFREIDLAINAKLRREQRPNAYVSRNGNWTSADFLVLPGKNPRLTRSSVISAFAVQSTEASKTGKFYLDAPELKEDYEKALEDSVEIKVSEINTVEFDKSKIAAYAFGTIYGKNYYQDKEDAMLYGEFLLKNGITKMPIAIPISESRPFARKVWFTSLDYRSELDGNWGLDYYDRVRGVRYIAKGTAKNLRGLAQDEVELLKKVRTGDLAPKELEALIREYS